MKNLLKPICASALSLALVCMVQTMGFSQNGSPSTAMQRPPARLKVGDPAPPLVAAKWVKGKPITQFEPGKVYIVEFWATWCGPCRASMPHLSEIARKYKGKAIVASFDVQELIAGKDKNADYVAKVERFVKRLGDGMDYNVAADVREGVMWDSWMKASGQGGIPSSFVIDQQGKIAWIGHPMSLDEVVGMVIDGTFDQAGREKLAAQLKERQLKVKDLTAQMNEAEKAGDYAKALQLVDQIVAVSPTSAGGMVKMKYSLLVKTDPSKARKFGEETLKKHANDPLTLQSLAMSIVDGKEDNGRKPDYELGLKIMKVVASRCDSEDPFATSALAKAYYKSGDINNAVQTQQKVVDLLNDTSLVEQKQTVKDEAMKDLGEYKSTLTLKAF